MLETEPFRDCSVCEKTKSKKSANKNYTNGVNAMKRKLDLASLGLGILLGVPVTGAYDALVNAMLGRTFEMWASMVATIITSLILFLGMAILGFFRSVEDTPSKNG